VLGRRRLILTLAALLAIAGAGLWLTMVRQEDPRLPEFWGQVVAPYPGADAETVEQQVLEPIEDALAEVAEVKAVDATAYDEMAVLLVELRGDTDDITEAWDEVREALDEARSEFPAGAGQPILDDEQQDQDSVVLAITGSADPIELLAGARRLRHELLAHPLVSKSELVADPEEQVTVDLDDATARRLGIPAPALVRQLDARNRVLPGGSLNLGGRSVRLRPLSEFESVEEIAATSVTLASGASIPLGEVARVHLGPREPARSRMRLDGEMSVGLTVVPRPAINLVQFGNAVRALVDRVSPELAPLAVREVTFQPARTAARLSSLNRSLLFGILIVAGVLVLAMGPRLGLLVASVVPLVAMASLALYAWSGGVLHQISIAALVLALGMLVDNAIVVSENVQWRLDHGETPRSAAAGAVLELARPLAGATLTTLAAFVPMLISQGPTAEFTRSIPIVIMITLSVSYLFAIMVTPILSEMALAAGAGSSVGRVVEIGRRLAGFAVRRSWAVLAAAVLLVGTSALGAGLVRQQFFPSADRNQFVVDLKLPEGAHLDATDAASRRSERALLARPEVTSVAGFMGRSAPRFYYNIMQVPFSPHFAQLVVTTRDTEDVEPVLAWFRDLARRELPEAEVVARRLEQGPPVAAPVEIRLTGHALDDLHAAATAVTHLLDGTAGTADVRHDLGPGSPTMRFTIDDAAAARHGVSRADVARALYGRTRGLSIGQLRSGEDPIPVVVRSAAGERLPAEDLDTVDVAAADGRLVPLAQVARVESAWRPAALTHRNGQRIVTVSSQLSGGATFSDVLAAIAPRLDQLDLPAGVSVSFGGDAEGSGEANSALLRSLPIGLMLLLGVLLAEFNSFRRVTIILATVPLAAAGVVPGLLLAGQPFGFMSFLGVIALIGIVVNNAIVLLAVVESQRAEGASLDDALIEAVSRRIRPILLTTATTVAGLLPLATSSSTLWPPLAWSMISGLLASTALTLLVVPALYRVLFARSARHRRTTRPALARAAAAGLVLLISVTVEAAEPLRLSLGDTMSRARTRPLAQAARAQADAADAAARIEGRLAYLPTVGVSASLSQLDRQLELVTPLGSFPFGGRRTDSVGVQLTQPLLDPVRLFYTAPASRMEADASRHEAARTEQQLMGSAADLHLRALAIDARLGSTEAFIDSLQARLVEMQEMVAAGRALTADALKVRLALEQAEQDRLTLTGQRTVVLAELARAVDHAGDVDPLPAPELLDRHAPDLQTLMERALEQRPDLAALAAATEATRRRQAAVRAELVPRLDATASWTWTDGSPYSDTDWAEAALVLTWTPFAAGTRGPRAAALAAEERALRASYDETLRAIEVDLKAAAADLDTARGAFEVGTRGVEQAQETLRVERERHLAGRVTTNDLLQAEAVLRDRRTVRDLARLEVTRAWIGLWLAIGAEALPEGV
jgi:multidrug efflux pump subunit AcrB/outer membrane protein TolC